MFNLKDVSSNRYANLDIFQKRRLFSPINLRDLFKSFRFLI